MPGPLADKSIRQRAKQMLQDASVGDEPDGPRQVRNPVNAQGVAAGPLSRSNQAKADRNWIAKRHLEVPAELEREIDEICGRFEITHPEEIQAILERAAEIGADDDPQGLAIPRAVFQLACEHQNIEIAEQAVTDYGLQLDGADAIALHLVDLTDRYDLNDQELEQLVEHAAEYEGQPLQDAFANALQDLGAEIGVHFDTSDDGDFDGPDDQGETDDGWQDDPTDPAEQQPAGQPADQAAAGAE